MTQIDTSRRGFLKSAVAASAAMMSAAAVHAGIPAKSVAKYDETFDVVIIGSGFAGMACALKAGRAGLKVLMIEKMSTVGGNSAICGGNVACPVNPVQKAQGIKDSKELFIADCLKDGLGINHTNGRSRHQPHEPPLHHRRPLQRHNPDGRRLRLRIRAQQDALRRRPLGSAFL